MEFSNFFLLEAFVKYVTPGEGTIFGPRGIRTSDSPNEGLPIKMTREKFQRKLYFSMKKTVGSTFDLSTKAVFSLDKYQLKIWFENSVFAIQHIENRKSFTEVLPPTPRDQTNPFAYSCSFTFHTSYKNGMIGHGGNAVKMLKNTLV